MLPDHANRRPPVDVRNTRRHCRSTRPEPAASLSTSTPTPLKQVRNHPFPACHLASPHTESVSPRAMSAAQTVLERELGCDASSDRARARTESLLDAEKPRFTRCMMLPAGPEGIAKLIFRPMRNSKNGPHQRCTAYDPKPSLCLPPVPHSQLSF